MGEKVRHQRPGLPEAFVRRGGSRKLYTRDTLRQNVGHKINWASLSSSIPLQFLFFFCSFFFSKRYSDIVSLLLAHVWPTDNAPYVVSTECDGHTPQQQLATAGNKPVRRSIPAVAVCPEAILTTCVFQGMLWKMLYTLVERWQRKHCFQ